MSHSTPQVHTRQSDKLNSPFSSHSAFLISSLSCQSSRLPCWCVECRAVWCCRPFKCLSQSDYSMSSSLTLRNATTLVSHFGLQGLTRLYLTPRVCGATTMCVNVRKGERPLHHTLPHGVVPPLASCSYFTWSGQSLSYTVNIAPIILNTRVPPVLVNTVAFWTDVFEFSKV